MKKIEIYLLLLLLTLFSCQQEEIGNEKVGYLQFSVEKNSSTILMPGTRANELPIALQVIDKSGNVIKETDDWHNWTSEPLSLPLGTYTIKAFSKDVNGNTARLGEPYYAGQAKVTVLPKVNQNVNIECKLADVKVSVTYSADVKKYFTSLNCKVSNSSGELEFGKDETRPGYFVAENLNVALALTNIDGKSFLFESAPIVNVASRQYYHINYSMKASGSVGDISITLDPTTKEYNVNISIPKDGAPTVNTWANFADISFVVAGEIGTKVCKYRVSGTEEWSSTSDDQVVFADGKLSARVEGLTPNTTYDFCFSIDGVNSKIATASTEASPQLPNSNFDEWNTGKIKVVFSYKDVWFAGTASEASALSAYWDSGNVGAVTLGVNPTSPEGSEVHTAGGKAAKLASQFVGAIGIGKFAAGNIYTGHYCQTYTSPMGARIRFGREFNSRPSQLKGWYKYTRGANIDYGDHEKSELTNSGGDKCAIYIALTDNAGLGDGTAYEVNNNDSNSPTRYTIDLSENNKDVIAYGSITDEESKGSFDESNNVVWKPFTIDLKYRDLTRKPKYIIVVASASKYGDFFTGSTGSVMLIDDFELVYGIPVTAN